MALRIIFCGTPVFAVPSLEYLLRKPDFQIVGVVTQPDRPSGRGQDVHSSPVKDAAAGSQIPVFQAERIKSDEGYEYFKQLAPDAVVIIAYGQIISPRLIKIPRLGWINLHASLLPKYRGAAPINWAIVNGDARTGVTTMQIDAGLDTGPTLLAYETEIAPDETAPMLAARLAVAGAPLVAETLKKLDRGEITPKPQDNAHATMARPLRKEDGRIDWSLSAHRIYNRIRGFDPWPGAYTSFRGKRCDLWGKPASEADLGAGFKLAPSGDAIALGAIFSTGGEIFVVCGAGTFLRLEFARLEARKRISAWEFANGARLEPGERFGS